MDERMLIQRAGAGDEAAFEQLVLAYEKKIYNLTLRMTGNREDAFDLTQETFLKAWHGIGLFQFDSKFSTWLCRIASNTCIDFLRRQRRRQAMSLIALDDENIPYEIAVADSSQDPARLTEAMLNREAIYNALNCLAPEYRMVLSLRAIDGMSYEEIGQALDLRPGTVKSRIARGREKLRLALAGNYSTKGSSKHKKGGAR